MDRGAARRARAGRGLVLALLAAAIAAPSARHGARQDPRAGQVIRAAVHEVPIYATVTDAKGSLVADLTRNDFEVDDNGKRQPIAVFKSDLQPIAVAILIDASPSVYRLADRIRGAVTVFTEHLLPLDRACLGTFNQVVSLDPTLTADRDVLIHHLGDDVPFPAGTALWDAIEAGRRALSAEGAHRVILVVTDAEDNCSRADPSAVRSHVEEDGAMVYVIGVRGGGGLAAREVDALSRATGGWYFELKPDDDVETAMTRVADELHRQYVLGFDATTLDNRTHRIDVRVSRPGLTVRARRSYLASARGDPH
jgi:Ca-activated chloride channel family protein